MDAREVRDEASFLAFLDTMRGELADGAQAWDNPTLPDFLEAMAAWAADRRAPADPNPWRHAADLLMAAALYE